MSYTDKDGRNAQIRIMDQIQPHWMQLAIALKFSPHGIATMECKSNPVYYLLTEWLREATKKEDQRPVTWRTLIESLQHANLQQEATVLDEHCVIPKEAADLDEQCLIPKKAAVLDEQCLIPKEAAVLNEQCMIPKEASQSGELHVH